jgi:hypothetical protein
MAVLDNGYVGVGTASPATALDVYGAITTRSTTGAGYVYISGTGTSANYSVLNLDNAQTGTSLKRWQVAHRVESPINRLAFFHYDGTGWYENMSILPSGVVAMPFQSRAKAYPSQTADQSIPNNSYTVLALSTEEFDTQAEYNASTYAFVAKTAGYYQVNANVTWGGTTAPGNFIVFIIKNGGSLATFERYRPIENAWFAESISNICYLNVGDSVQLMVWQNSGSANSVVRYIDRTYLAIHKLS